MMDCLLMLNTLQEWKMTITLVQMPYLMGLHTHSPKEGRK